jgi:hypothetical protein
MLEGTRAERRRWSRSSSCAWTRSCGLCARQRCAKWVRLHVPSPQGYKQDCCEYYRRVHLIAAVCRARAASPVQLTTKLAGGGCASGWQHIARPHDTTHCSLPSEPSTEPMLVDARAALLLAPLAVAACYRLAQLTAQERSSSSSSDGRGPGLPGPMGVNYSGSDGLRPVLLACSARQTSPCSSTSSFCHQSICCIVRFIVWPTGVLKASQTPPVS